MGSASDIGTVMCPMLDCVEYCILANVLIMYLSITNNYNLMKFLVQW